MGLLLIVGYLLGYLMMKIKMPEITGFIIAGLLIGPFFGGMVSHHQTEELQIITEVALGIIALTIGGEFSIRKLKRTGKAVLIITLAQIVLTFCLTSLGLILFQMDWPYALILGAIATATAPAATVAIVQKLRAKGLFVDYLFGVVALDDAGAVIVFGGVSALVTGIIGGAGGDHGSMTVFFHALEEIGFSLLSGPGIGI
jgi:Kef-type K+ transport system membrane component KefB